ncbi:MAG: flavodoxin family protein [Armatimonadota bacterium]
MYLIISASPNTDGLTAACVNAALAGFQESGAETLHYDLCKWRLEHCRQCDNGWGQCRREHTCIIEDDLPLLQRHVAEAEGFVIVTPVYYGEPSESAKAALDRLRRCESTRGESCAVAGKPVIAVAAAGGSGNGTITCLLTLENWIKHLRGQVADLITITQRSRGYKLAAIQSAAAMVGKLVKV